MLFVAVSVRNSLIKINVVRHVVERERKECLLRVANEIVREGYVDWEIISRLFIKQLNIKRTHSRLCLPGA